MMDKYIVFMSNGTVSIGKLCGIGNCTTYHRYTNIDDENTAKLIARVLNENE